MYNNSMVSLEILEITCTVIFSKITPGLSIYKQLQIQACTSSPLFNRCSHRSVTMLNMLCTRSFSLYGKQVDFVQLTHHVTSEPD